MKLTRTLLIVAAAAALSASACSKKDDANNKKKKTSNKTTIKKTEPGKTDPGKTDPGKTDPDKMMADIKVDTDVMKAFKAALANCEIDPKAFNFKCKAGEVKKLEELWGYQTDAKKRIDTIGTIAVVLSDPEPKMRALGANILGSKFNSGWGDNVNVGGVKAVVADRLLATLPKLSKYGSRRAVTGIVYAATLARRDDAAIKVLDASADTYLKSSGYKALTLYGRLTSFAKLQELGKSSNKQDVLAAVAAANSFYKYTDAEKAKLCPWAKTFLTADDQKAEESPIFEQVGFVLTGCGGKWLDDLLAFGEAQAKKGKFDRQYFFVYRNICFQMMRGVDKRGATKAQCDRNYKFLEKVANTKMVDSESRGLALWSIYYQRRDKKSKKLMKRYRNHPDKEVKKNARSALKSLKDVK